MTVSLTNGLLSCSIEGQSDSIVQDIETMVRSFIEKVLLNNLHKFFLLP